MQLFERLRTLSAFRKEHADLLGKQEDRLLISEIGFHQTQGKPLTLKQLFLLDIGSISTVQRRLWRLKELGMVRARPAAVDRRAVELTLSLKCMKILARYDKLANAQPSAPGAAGGSGEARHVCGLCDSDTASRDLLVAYLAQGLKRGDKCVLVAPIGSQNEILDKLPHRRRAAEALVVSDGHTSPDDQIAFLKGIAVTTRKASRCMTLAADMSWTFAKDVKISAVMDIEKRSDALATRFPLTALCVYDARRFSSGDFLHAMKCHRDHLRHPVLLG